MRGETDTQAKAYSNRLKKIQNAWWKRLFNVQAPYAWNVRRLAKGSTLEIGCGIGRNLAHLHGRAIGVDHNADAVLHARRLGYRAFLPEEFLVAADSESLLFDNLLLSHVVEHMRFEDACDLVNAYLRFLKPGGRVIIIVPQEAGYKSDHTHVTYFDHATIFRLACVVGLREIGFSSFPFPGWAGGFFLYNEFVSILKYEKNIENSCRRHSFCVAAYGESEYLESCLNSIAAQSLQSRLLLCTATPSGFLESMAHKYGFEYCVRSGHPGIGADWNFAYQCAETPLLTIAHQDDIYHPEYTEYCLRAFEQHGDILMLFTDYAQLINGQSYRWRPVVLIKRLLVFPFWWAPNVQSAWIRRLVLMLGNPVSCPSVVLNKALLTSEFRFDEGMKTNLDWDAWLRLSSMPGSFFRVSKTLLKHRIHAGSATTKTIQDKDRMTEDMLIFERIWGRSFAKVIMWVYRLSHWINNVGLSSARD